MNVSCPECQSVFRVDPAKVPSEGVRARCAVCGGVITVGIGTPIDEEFAPTRVQTAPARVSRGVPVPSHAYETPTIPFHEMASAPPPAPRRLPSSS